MATIKAKKEEKIKGVEKRVTIHPFTLLSVTIFVCLSAYYFFLSTPTSFPLSKLITIEKGIGISKEAEVLKQAGVIRSEFFFKAWVVLLGGRGGLIAGDYFLKEREGVIPLAYRMTRGLYNTDRFKVFVPEGMSVKEIVTLFSKTTFPKFDPKKFLSIALPQEGYLFPDTYFFLQSVTAEEVVNVMTTNFNEKIHTLASEILVSKKTLKDIVIMASILEEEARTSETRKMISGILWNRLSMGMPLQVDATFLYINGKNTFNLTRADLATDSPYNTYKYKGLPPGPITNPGLDSILSAVTPTKNPYIFYLSDMKGEMHYAVTYDEHLVNKAKYIR